MEGLMNVNFFQERNNKIMSYETDLNGKFRLWLRYKKGQIGVLLTRLPYSIIPNKTTG
jgi:hypothetical protein